MSIVEDENFQKLENKVFLTKLIHNYFDERFEVLNEKYQREAKEILIDFEDSELLKEFYKDVFNKLNTVSLYWPRNSRNIKPGHFNKIAIENNNFTYYIDEILKSPLSIHLLNETFPGLKETNIDGSNLYYINLKTSLDVATAKVFIRYKIKDSQFKLFTIEEDFKDISPFYKLEYLKNFKSYVSLHIIVPYSDYSYLFQRLLNEGFIEKVKHLDFMNWLHLNNIISEKVYDDFKSIGFFKSLHKSSADHRINNFNNVFKI